MGFPSYISGIRKFLCSSHPCLQPSATWQYCHLHLAPSTLSAFHIASVTWLPPPPPPLLLSSNTFNAAWYTPLPWDTFHCYHHLIEMYFSGAHQILDRIRIFGHIPNTITNVSYPWKQQFFMTSTISIQASKALMHWEAIQVCIDWILPHSRLNKSTSW